MPDEDEPLASIATEALQGYASGCFQTTSEVQHFLDRFPEYPKSSNGKAHWQRVRELLTRPIYAGYVGTSPMECVIA